MQGDQVVYEATVPNQNQGKTVPFTLNPNISDTLSFENPAHDFPTRIQYIPKSDDEVFVRVLGSDGKGFSYVMVRK